MLHRNDILSLASLLVGLASSAAALTPVLSSFLPAHVANIVLGVLGAVGILASQVIRVYSVPADTGQIAVAQAQVQAAKTAAITTQQVMAAKPPT